MRILATLLSLLIPGYPALGNVFGPDSRRASERYLPVGRIINGEKSFCTATVVGEKEILTAAHCLLDASGNPKLSSLLFTIKGPNGTALSSPITGFRRDSSLSPIEYREKDAAIAFLEKEVGQETGFAGLSFEEVAPFTPIELVAFHHDLSPETLFHSGECKSYPSPASIAHDCDLTGGSSGGPIFLSGTDLVIAVQAAQYSMLGTELYRRYKRSVRNIAAPLSRNQGLLPMR